MIKKRGNNEGSIFRRKNGSWRAQATLQGCRLSKTFNTRKEAQQWLKETINQIDNGLTYASTQLTLGQFLDSWLISTKSSYRSSTWEQYHRVIQRYINPQLGIIKIHDLRPDQIQGLYNHLISNGTGEWTVIKVHNVLHGALAHAFKTGMIPRNPASQTIRPKEPVKEMRVLDENQISQLLISVKDTQWETLLHLAISTGMRQMEILGLCWDDLDWVKQTIFVHRQLVRSNSKNIQYAPLKTRYSRRIIELGARTIELLRVQDKRQHEMRLAAGERWNEYNLIFTTRYGGKIHPRNLLRGYKNVLRKANLPENRFHDLRHTAASLMLNLGIPVIVVSRRLGHARPSITLDVYGHLIPSMQSEAAQRIDDFVTPLEIDIVAPGCTRLHQEQESRPPHKPQHPNIQAK